MSDSTRELSRQLEAMIAAGDFVVPPYPAAALRLRRLVESGKYGLADVADAAAADPVLAATLLRIANSPLYRSDGPPVTTLLRAVNRVGARSISSMALAASVGGAACATGPLLDVRFRIWRRSVTCALAAQHLAPARQVEPSEAFLAGLLHGFGRAVAAACLERLLAKSAARRSVAEWLALLEPQRPVLARRVAQHWELPAALVAAVVADGTASPCGLLVALGDRIACALEQGAGVRELSSLAELRAGEASTLEAFVTRLPEAVLALTDHPEPARGDRASKAVTKPPSVLRGDLRATNVMVLDLRKRKEPERLRARALTRTGLVLESQRPMQESSVARLALQITPAPIEGWFNVALCVAEGKLFRIEVEAFAPGPELVSALDTLWTEGSKHSA